MQKCSFYSKQRQEKIPVILVTAKNGAEKLAELCGVDDLLKKPFTLEDLISTVEKYTGTSADEDNYDRPVDPNPPEPLAV